MKPKLIALILILFASPAFAQLLIVGSNPTTYHLVHRDKSGNVTLTKVTQVIQLDGTGGPGDPLPPIDPTPPTSDPLRSVVQKLTQAVNDPTTARAMAAVYDLVADQLENGGLKEDKAFAAVKAATDLVMTQQQAEKKWEEWRRLVGNEIIKLQQDGRLKTKKEMIAAFRSIEGGLQDVTLQRGILDNINWERLIELIKLIITLISSFS